jgi:hypothetical protein
MIIKFYSNKSKFNIPKKNTLPIVSNDQITQNLHDQPNNNENKIQPLMAEIINIKFSSRTEFEKFILGYLNSHFLVQSSIVAFLCIIPVFLSLIGTDYVIIIIFVTLVSCLRLFFQYLCCMRNGIYNYASKLNKILAIVEVIICFATFIIPFAFNLSKDTTRGLLRIGYFVILGNLIAVINTSVKIANNEDRTLLIGEAEKKFTFSENDGYYVTRTTKTILLKVCVPYPDYLKE